MVSANRVPRAPPNKSRRSYALGVSRARLPTAARGPDAPRREAPLQRADSLFSVLLDPEAFDGLAVGSFMEALSMPQPPLFLPEHPAAADELFLQEEEEARAAGALMAVEWPERLGLDLPEAWRLDLSHQDEGRLAQLTSPRNEST